MSGTNDKPVNRDSAEPLPLWSLWHLLGKADAPSRELDGRLYMLDPIVIEHGAQQDQIPPYTNSIEAAKGLVQRALPESYVSNDELMMPWGTGLRLWRNCGDATTAFELCTLLIEALIAREA